jgi:alpha-L-fucosidase
LCVVVGMKKGVMAMEAIQCRCVLLALVVVVVVAQLPSSVVALKNCSRPAIYAFGDSLTDVGNSIAAFPDQFYEEELDPELGAYGVEFPMHGADRWSDGKLLVDFLGK